MKIAAAFVIFIFNQINIKLVQKRSVYKNMLNFQVSYTTNSFHKMKSNTQEW